MARAAEATSLSSVLMKEISSCPGPRPVSRAQTWLLAVGYRRYPPPSLAEVPGGTS